ncbi:transcription initiation factor IIB [Natronoarchaeum rubrum]|uniref:transcription initiation factor IIB n=1 Tax=Natronoarchaeum rubrum TaxID=755311 RepID=UPI002112F4D7|nr:transcription initiation factor IIB family protein [Natronoarchaeum rubrum]
MAISDIYETAFDEDVQQETTTNQCPECDGRVTTNTVETVCEECGLVIDEQRIDPGPEWRSFDKDQRERTGAPLTVARHDRGLSTEIGRGIDAKGNGLSGRKRRQLRRLRREQTRGKWQSKADRNLAHGLGEVRRIASALGLSETIRDQACALFRSAQSEQLLRGRSIEGMAAGSVYGACRCNGLARTLDDVSKVAQVTQSRVTNCYQTLNAELGLPAKPVTPGMFVPRLASELGISDSVRRRAQALAEVAEDGQITTGVSPSGFAGACIYTAARECEQVLTQAQVVAVADVSPVTLRKHRNALVETY